ncbi:MAG: isoprenylcysteine carboxylmethyltransferase family protein [Burkholderiaceae bacterium]|nr:MAG: isoprenylcysteine carboxylmethyltransferase family protein [Burkholderiaceae bacterium]
MKMLELKIPPPLLALLFAFLMWALAPLELTLPIHGSTRLWLALLLACQGLAISLAGALALRRARTTINPFKPETSTAVVSTGIFRFTRNPMYLGLTLVLLGWAAYLRNATVFLWIPLFMLYLTRFQIVPEERALAERFGSEFTAYRMKVGRWL